MQHRFKKEGVSTSDEFRNLKPGDIKVIAVEDAIASPSSYRTAASMINGYLGRKRYEVATPKGTTMIILKDNG